MCKARRIWELSAFSTQFCYGPKTALKKLNQLKITYVILSHTVFRWPVTQQNLTDILSQLLNGEENQGELNLPH